MGGTKILFGHSFMRGRRNRLSNEYYHFTIKALECYFAVTSENLEESYKRLKKQKKYFDKESRRTKYREREKYQRQGFQEGCGKKNPL
ncbi:MAG: hypothetical protein ACXQT5_03075 [Candidatus Syntropharchaeia archaeon]